MSAGLVKSPGVCGGDAGHPSVSQGALFGHNLRLADSFITPYREAAMKTASEPVTMMSLLTVKTTALLTVTMLALLTVTMTALLTVTMMALLTVTMTALPTVTMMAVLPITMMASLLQ